MSAPAERAESKYLFLIKDGSFEGFLYGLRYALMAATFGHPVTVHFVGWAAERLKLDRLSQVELPEEFRTLEDWYAERLGRTGVRDLRQYFQLLKQANARLTVCSLAAAIHELRKEDLVPEIDAIAGTTTVLLEEIERADKILIF